MKRHKPVIQNPVTSPQPVLKKTFRDQEYWSFSFKYFKQIKYFGLGETNPKWFISTIDRLTELSSLKIDDFFKDFSLRDSQRFHKINWEQPNIPIQRKDFDWVDSDILVNEEDYPFFQIQISTALGRIIGFWDEDYRFFYILLLDPKHNMQPVKKYDYRVDDTTIMPCEHTSLLNDIDRIKGIKCKDEDCRCKKELAKIPDKLYGGKFVYFILDNDYYDEFKKQTKDKNLKDIIEMGLLSM